MKKAKYVGRKVISAVLMAAMIVSATPVNVLAEKPVKAAADEPVVASADESVIAETEEPEAASESGTEEEEAVDPEIDESSEQSSDDASDEISSVSDDAKTDESGPESTDTDEAESISGSSDSASAESSGKTEKDEPADKTKVTESQKTVTPSDNDLLSSDKDVDNDGPEDEEYYTPAEPEKYENVSACGDYEYVLSDDNAVITGYTGDDLVIDIPEELDGYKVTKVGDRAFCGEKFATVTIPDTVTVIGVEAFSGCRLRWVEDSEYCLYGFYLPDSVIEIGERAFKDVDFNINPFKIPASIQTIGRGAFEDSFTVIEFADGLEKVPDYALYKASRLSAALLPETVTEIGKYAFYKCAKLYEVEWNESITTIGKSAFFGCTSLRNATADKSAYHDYDSIDMPDALKNIGDFAFGGWDPDDNGEGYYPTEGEVTIEMPLDLEYFSTSIFYGTKIRTLHLPREIDFLGKDDPDDPYIRPFSYLYINNIVFNSNHIPDYFCKGMYMLHSITIPDEIDRIGDEAFAECKALSTILGCEDEARQDYDEQRRSKRFKFLNYIGNRAFYGCFFDLNYIYLSQNFEYIGDDAFGQAQIENVYFPLITLDDKNCGRYQTGCRAFDGAQKITFAEGTTFIPDNACYGDSFLKEVVIPDTVEEIGNYAFREAGYSGAELAVPDNITTIGEGAFWNSVFVIANIPQKTTKISDFAYSGCTFKHGAGIPSGVNTIGKSAFSACTMDSVVIPSSVTELPNCVFADAKFDSLTLHDNIYSIDDNAFAASSVTRVELPSNLHFIGDSAFAGCAKLTSISIPGSISEIPQAMCDSCYELSQVTFPEGITAIGGFAFYDCQKLTNVDLPEALTDIGNSAFGATGLESVRFGKNISAIGDSAFSRSALTNVEIPKSVYSLGRYAFLGCKNLSYVKLSGGITAIPTGLFQNCEALKEIEIPEGYTTIGSSAFSGCKALSTIKIPLALVTVEKSAFLNSGLMTVKYPGTPEDFGLIQVYSDNYPFLSATKEYMSIDDRSIPGVVLSATSVTLEEGDTKKLYAVVYPRKTSDQHVTWTSSDKEVATVDAQGKVTAKSAGRATVQAKADNGLIASCFVSVTKDGLSITDLKFDGGMPTITVPENIPIYGGKDFSVGMPIDLPVTVIWEDGYVKIGINVSADVLSGDNHGGLKRGENWKSFKEEWEDFFDDVKKANQLTTKDLNWFKSAQAKQNLRANIPGVKGKVSVGAAGYMEAFWNEGQNKIQGELLIMLEGSETFSGQFMLAQIPVTVLFTVGASGTLMAEVGYDFNNVKWYGDLQLMAALNLDLFFGAGAGDWLSVGAYGKATASSTIVLMSTEKTPMPLKDWSISGEAGLRAYFAKKSASLPIVDGTYDIYKDFKKVDHSKKKTSSLYADEEDDDIYIDSSGNEFYVSLMDATDGVLNKQPAEDGTIVYDAYNAAKPSFAISDDATMLVYVTDDKSRALPDQSKLVYSIIDVNTGIYSDAKAVLDDGSADYEPVVYSNGSDIYVAWLDSTRKYGSDEDGSLQDYVGAFKLHVARYNPESGEFDDLGTMQDENVSSFTYLASFVETSSGLELVYVENSDNALFGLSDNNSINRWRLEEEGWTKIESIDSLKAVSGLDVMDFGNSQLAYYYAIDKDNDFSTNEQKVVATAPGYHYEFDVEGITSLAFMDLPSLGTILAANIEGGLYYLDEDGYIELLPKGTMNKDSKFEASGDNIYYLVNGDENRNIGVASYSMEEWGTALLTGEDGYVDNFSVSGDGICYLCNDVAIGEGLDFDVYSRIKVLYSTTIIDAELEDVDYSPWGAIEGSEFLTYLYIKNNGTRRLNDVRAAVTYNGEEIAAENINVSLVPGAVQPYEFSFVLPEQMNAGGDYEIKVTAAGEADYSNNSKTISLKKADLAVQATYDDSGEVPYVVIAVENKGLLDSNMTLTVKDEEGKILYEETDMASAGQLLAFKEEYTSNKKQILSVEVTGDADEFYLMNNTTSVSVGKDSQEPDPSDDPGTDPETDPEKEEAFSVRFAGNAPGPYDGLSYNYDSKRYETVFTGTAIKPEVVVNGYAGRLKEGVDYTLTYSNNVKANDKKPATITITGKGNYAGKKKLEFYIVKADLAKLVESGKVTVQDEVRIQSGKKASVAVSYGDYALKASDYTLSNTKAIKQDTQIDVIGKGNFTGTLTGINVHVLSSAEVKNLTIKAAVKAKTRTFNGSEQVLSVASPGTSGEITVTAGTSKDILEDGKDFEVTYENNTNAGKAKVIIKGKGEYLGTVTKTFTIAPDKTCRIECTLKDSSEKIYYDPARAKPEILVTAYRGTESQPLDEGKDYKVTYSANKKVGTGKYTVNFIGDYKGHASLKNNTFEIVPAPFDGADIYCGDKIYNKPGKYLFAPMVMVGDRLLGSKDYNVKYYDGAVDASTEITSRNKLKITLADDEKSREIFVVVSGKGNYEETSLTTSYKVYRADKKQVDLSKCKIVARDKNSKGKDIAVSAKEYTGDRVEPQFRVLKKNGKTWEEVDSSIYSFDYVNNVNRGSATIIVNGNGQDSVGSVSTKFKIGTRNMGIFNFLPW